ncbi:VOC family protein [Salipiger abyssi]|nr:VOC family protein [Salipiger abyssi]
MLLSLHHIQLAMPRGREAEAIAFYADVLGLDPVEKPAPLRSRGGVWFEGGALRVHLGIEEPFAPARKAHPAFQVANLDAMIARLDRAGLSWRRDIDLPGLRRIYVDDPFGNRIELLEPHAE